MELQSIESIPLIADATEPKFPTERWFQPIEVTFNVSLTPESEKAWRHIVRAVTTHADLHRMTRKRFLKLMMSRGHSRNAAVKIADSYHMIGMSWAEAWAANYKPKEECP